MGGAGDRAGASQQQRRALPRGDHPCSEGSEEDRAMHSGLLLEQGGYAATSGRTARSAESEAPDAAPGPRKLREAAADCLPGGGNRDSRTWPRAAAARHGPGRAAGAAERTIYQEEPDGWGRRPSGRLPAAEESTSERRSPLLGGLGGRQAPHWGTSSRVAGSTTWALSESSGGALSGSSVVTSYTDWRWRISRPSGTGESLSPGSYKTLF